MFGVEQGHPRADGEDASGGVLVGDGEFGDAATHSIHGDGAGLERLLGQETDELVSADAIDRVTGARATGELLGDGDDDLVTPFATVAVVESLKLSMSINAMQLRSP